MSETFINIDSQQHLEPHLRQLKNIGIASGKLYRNNVTSPLWGITIGRTNFSIPDGLQ